MASGTKPSAIVANSRGTAARTPRPTVLALRDEGEGLFALYLAPIRLADLAPALAAAGLGDHLYVLGLRRGDVRRVDLAAADGIIEGDVVHAVDGAPGDVSVLADPHGAVAFGRLALTLSHDGHVVAYSLDRVLLTALIDVALTARHATEVPLPAGWLPVEAQPEDGWIDVETDARAAFTVVIASAGGEELARCVRRRQGAWRTGWRW